MTHCLSFVCIVCTVLFILGVLLGAYPLFGVLILVPAPLIICLEEKKKKKEAKIVDFSFDILQINVI
jgi:hypothetical protein